MTMRREQLYITVPSLFRCPISLDVMKSPVSLCTGVTYDRSSIQKWLESGHDTCPATMQVLPSKDFVPNLTLHRLINLWIQSSAPRTPISPCHPADLVRAVESPSPSCSDALSKAVDFANRSDDNRRRIVGFNGFLEAVSGVLRRKSEKVEVLESAVRALVSMLVENGVKERLNRLILRSSQYVDYLSSIDSIIENGGLTAKIESIRLLESIAIDAESRRRIAQSQNLPSALIRLVKENDNSAVNDAVISLLVKISVTGSAISQVVQNGVVEVLSSTINDDTSKNHENAMKLLGIVSRSSEGRVAMSEDARCAAGIAERLLKSSREATEEGVAALWRLCCAGTGSGRDERVKEAVVNSGGLTKLLVVLQRQEEGSFRRMCRDLVKALTAASKGRPLLGSYQTKTMHIMPC